MHGNHDQRHLAELAHAARQGQDLVSDAVHQPQRGDNHGGQEGRGDIIDGVLHRVAKDVTNAVDVVTNSGK